MIETLFHVLDTGLSLWLSKERTKYIDQLISLKKEYYDEYKKDEKIRSDAVLDDIIFRVRILGLAFTASAGGTNTKV